LLCSLRTKVKVAFGGFIDTMISIIDLSMYTDSLYSKPLNVANLFWSYARNKSQSKKVKKKTQFAYEIKLVCERLFRHNDHDHPWNVILVLTTGRLVNLKENQEKCNHVVSSYRSLFLMSHRTSTI
jgi:hypothetical protein